jgi:hypothetical protein
MYNQRSCPFERSPVPLPFFLSNQLLVDTIYFCYTFSVTRKRFGHPAKDVHPEPAEGFTLRAEGFTLRIEGPFSSSELPALSLPNGSGVDCQLSSTSLTPFVSHQCKTRGVKSFPLISLHKTRGDTLQEFQNEI